MTKYLYSLDSLRVFREKMKSKLLAKYNKILEMEEMNPFYLDKFDINKFNIPKISAIIPTYNRAPHTVKDDANPLGWCLESLLSQKGNFLDEIIVVDDASTDYTEEVVKDFQKKTNLEIKYFKNLNNLGSSISRNRAVKESTNNFILFLDDDCIFSNYFVFGAGFTLNNLPKDVAAVHLPIYHRKMKPSLVEISEIGVLNLKNGLMTANYGGFPISYTKNLEKNLLDSKLKIIAPLEITNLGGIFVIKKDAFQGVGGFPDFLTWKNKYREETNLAISLTDAGYKMFFTPDPKFYSVHLKYGAKSNENEFLNANQSLRRLISYSNIKKKDTGNRVDTEEWFFDRIISTYVTIGRKDIRAAKKYLKITEKEFVKNNNLEVTGVLVRINNFLKRKTIFNKAVSEGNKLLMGMTG